MGREASLSPVWCADRPSVSDRLDVIRAGARARARPPTDRRRREPDGLPPPPPPRSPPSWTPRPLHARVTARVFS